MIVRIVLILEIAILCVPHGDCGATQNHEVSASPESTENSKEAIKHLKHLLRQTFDLAMRHCHLQVHTQELSNQIMKNVD